MNFSTVANTILNFTITERMDDVNRERFQQVLKNYNETTESANKPSSIGTGLIVIFLFLIVGAAIPICLIMFSGRVVNAIRRSMELRRSQSLEFHRNETGLEANITVPEAQTSGKQN